MFGAPLCAAALASLLLLGALGGLPAAQAQLSKPNLHDKPVDAAGNKFLQRTATDDLAPPAPKCASLPAPWEGERETVRAEERSTSITDDQAGAH